MILDRVNSLYRVINFTKMHGIGNDFVIVEKRELAGLDQSILAKKISSYKLGIGCDQFIIYDREESSYKVQMEIYNPDGTVAKACGNASRCLMRLLFDQYGMREVTLVVLEREVMSSYEAEQDIVVDMGRASFNAPWMPKVEDLWPIAEGYMIDPKEMVCVDVGNPHLVIFAKLSAQDQEIIGSFFQKSALFLDGVNVNFAEIIGEEIFLKVWERGTGFTLACGSGASASFAAAVKLGFVQAKAEVVFELGRLKMRMSKTTDGTVIMSGPAEYVFKGEYYVS